MKRLLLSLCLLSLPGCAAYDCAEKTVGAAASAVKACFAAEPTK